MKKVLSAILLIIMILLVIQFGAMLFKVTLHIGLILLKIAVRFWFVWLAVAVYFMLRDNSSNKKKNSSDDIIDADFTVVDEEEVDESPDKEKQE